MNKIKLRYFAVFLITSICIFAGCENRHMPETAASAPAAAAPQQAETSAISTNKAESSVETKAATGSTVPAANGKAALEENLCASNEEVMFGFKTSDSSKILSVCISKNQDYIVTRYGTKNKIELEFPENRNDSWDAFTYSYYLRAGGPGNEELDLNYLSFADDKFEYQLYQEYSASDNETKIGLKMKDKATSKETDIAGLESSLAGGLIGLRDNEKIKTENF